MKPGFSTLTRLLFCYENIPCHARLLAGPVRPRGPFPVTNNLDSGAGSLRQALLDATAAPGPDVITFAPSLAGQTISLVSTISIFNAGEVTVDASAAPGLVINDGSAEDYGLFFINVGSTVTFRALTLAKGGGANFATGGGAINTGGTVTLERCTLSENRAGSGGAILNSGTLALANCTLSGNSASFGGAISNTGTLTLKHCTLSGNSASVGGAIASTGTITTLVNTIAAGNINPAAADISGTFPNSPTNLIGGDPKLGPLADNGGPTKTMALLPGSPALDAGVPIDELVLDQRGFPRIRDGNDETGARPDIGAYEAQAAPTVTTPNPIVVTTAVDEADPNGTLGAGVSLREALRDGGLANIVFDAALNGKTITLAGGLDLPVYKSVTIDASALPSGLTIDGGTGTNRIFTVASGTTVSLVSLTLRGAHGHGQDLFVGGGAISNHGTLTLTNCTLTGSSTTTVGGAIFNDTTGTLTLTGCQLGLNHADDAGGAIQNVGTLTLTSCTLALNSATNSGGAIINNGPLTVTNCTFTSNNAKKGGALDTLYSGGQPTLTGCTFTANTASTDGNPSTGLGGAIYNENNVALTGCTFASNRTEGTLTLFDTTSGYGGAIYNPAGKFVTATNCTFTGNSSVYNGGAIASRGSLTITHCTFAGNAAASPFYGGAISAEGGTLSLGYSIVAGNTSISGPDIYKPASGGATIMPVGTNLIGKNNTVSGDFQQGPLVGIDASPVVANLGPLASNGGSTQTMVPQPGSLAIDAATPPTPSTDQRGQLRPTDGDGNGSAVADLGAVERGRLLLPVVSTTAESGPGSLRQAIADAATVPDTTITFAAGFTGPIVLASEITVPANAVITVDASNVTAGLVLSGGGAHRIFHVSSDGNLTLKGMVLTGGGISGDGGAILNSGTLTLTQCTLSGNSASGRGGAIFNDLLCRMRLTQCTLSGNSADSAGAIDNAGDLTLTQCTLAGNSARNSGGAIFNIYSAALINTIVAGNTAPTGPDISGFVNAFGKNLIGNLAGSGLSAGDSVIEGAANLSPLGNYGGRTQTMLPLAGSPAIDAGDNAAIPAGITTDQRGSLLPFGASVDIGAVEVGRIVTNTADSGAGSLREAVNSTVAGGMVINFDPVALNGQTIALLTRISLGQDIEINAEGLAAGVTLDAGLLNNRIFRVLAGKTAALHNLTLTRGGGTAFNQFGGAILNDGNLTLTRCTISNSQVKTGNSGGAISSGTGSTLALTDCTLSGNTADSGGAIQTVATVTLNRCTLNGNTARNGQGGAISGNTSTVSLTQCTVAGNTAMGTVSGNGNGGGIFCQSSLLSMIHCTIAGNTASGNASNGSGGGVVADGQNVGGFAIANTIIAGNNAVGLGPDIYELRNVFENVRFTGRVFISDLGPAGSNGFSANDRVRTGSAMLNSLGNYGGPTQTMVPLADSPVRDLADGAANVNAAIPVNFATDQRGFPRRVFAAADLGATEAGSISLTNLVLSAGALTPGFDPATIGYTASVPSGTASVTITPTTAVGTITVKGTAVASGTASGLIALTAGQATPINVVVTGLDGATRTYTVAVTRAASTNADLAGLTLSMGTLSPSFSSGTTAYAAGVLNTTSSLTVTATRADPNATLQVQVNGGGFSPLTSGTASGQLALNVGGGNTIDVKVTAQDGTTTQTYTVTVTRAKQTPSVTLGSSAPSSAQGQSVTFTATVTGSGTPTGTVTFLDGASSLGNGTLSGGSATLSTSALTAGTHNISATYNGDANFNGATSVALAQTVNATALIVTSTLDVGSGTLRQALSNAASHPGADVITLHPDLDGGTLALGSELVINDSGGAVTLDASALPHGFTLTDTGDVAYRLMSVTNGTTLTVRGMTFADGGGAAFTGSGGALLNGGTVALETCTFSGNTAVQGGAIQNQGTLTLTQCTLAGNACSANGPGSAIFNFIGSATLTHCTVSGNTPNHFGALGSNATLWLNHCIVAGNTATVDDADIHLPGNGSLTRSGANIVQSVIIPGSGTQSGPAAINLPPLLAPLGNYGGPTQTMPPLPGSPAIDQASVLSPALTMDQRGAPRPRGLRPDIGAVEADILTVTTAADELDAPGVLGAGLSLREAVRDVPAGGTIVFDRAVFTGATATTNTITLTKGPLNPPRNCTLNGSFNPNGITILTQFTITQQPLPLSVTSAAAANFAVTVTNLSGGLAFQWRKDGSNVGANNAAFAIPSSQETDEGVYDVALSETAAPGTLTLISVTKPAAMLISQPASLIVDGAPVTIQRGPSSAMLALGSSYTLSVVAVGPATPALTYQWKKNGSSISGATRSTYVIANAQLSHAGAYTCLVKSGTVLPGVTSATAEIGVVDTRPATTVSLALPATASFSPMVSAAGNSLTFAWKRDATVLASTANAFTINPVTLDNAGLYTCTVTGPGGVITNGCNKRLNVITAVPALVTPLQLPAAAIGQAYYYQIPVQPTPGAPATVFNISGTLPTGITLNTTTGVLSGRPTVTRPAGYPLTFRATNIRGSSEAAAATLMVNAVPANAVGTFAGPAEISPLNDNLGGRLDLTTTTTGLCSGGVTLGARAKISFANQLLLSDGANDLILRATLSGITMADKTPLAASLEIFVLEQVARLTLTHPNGNSLIIPAWRNAWNSTTNKATAYAAYYTARLDAGTGSAASPEGYGYASFTVSTAGALTVAGKLPDGSGLTGGTFVGANGEVLLFNLLYANRGSIVGQFNLTAVTPTIDNMLGGSFSWFKPGPKPPLTLLTSTDTVYKAGFGPLPLNVVAEGGVYVPPAKGQRVMGLLTVPNPNARLSFTLGSLAPDFTQTLNIVNPSATGLTNTAVVTAPITNTTRLTTMDAAKGFFNGSFQINGATAALHRPAPFEGMIVKIGASTQGYGYFLLPTIPVAPKTVTTSPKQSGRVLIGVP